MNFLSSSKIKVVANATPFIALAKIGRLNLLKEIFGEIIVPKEVYEELVVRGVGREGPKELKKATWLKVLEVEDKTKVGMLLGELDKGEAEAVVLAQELYADLLLIDEEKARITARLAGIKQLGTVGLVLLAKELKLISKVRPIFDRLITTGFRVSNRVYQEALKEANEG